MKTAPVVIAILLMLGVTCPVFAHDGHDHKPAATKSIRAASGKSLSLSLSGLHCAGCAMSVQSRLLQVPGVAAVTVDPKRQSAKITLAKGAKRPTDAVLKSAVKAAGYTCTNIKS